MVAGRDESNPQPKTADLQSAESPPCSTYPMIGRDRIEGCGLVVDPATDGRTLEPTTDSNPEPAVYNRCSTN